MLRDNLPLPNTIKAVSANNVIFNDANVSIIWFDKNTCLQDDVDVHETKQMLQEIKADVILHSNLDGLMTLIEKNPQKNFFLIMSAVEAVNITNFQRIHDLKQIHSIFIFCLEKEIYEPIFTHHQYMKITGIYNTQLELYLNITRTLDHVNRQFAAFTLFNQNQQSIRDLTNDSIRFLWYQLLKDTLWKMPRTTDWKIRMVEKCRDYYRGNAYELKHIEDFEIQYQSSDAVKWYTKDTFIYKLINQALRTEDIIALYMLRYFIEDLCVNLKNRYEEFRQLQIDLEMPNVTLYRGLRLDQNQLSKCKMSSGNLISTNGFLSASRSIDVAKIYAGWDTNCQSTADTTESVLFIIHINVSDNNIIVADITAESQIPDELEVLFDIGSIFEINSVTEDDAQKPSKWTINMTASNDGDKLLNDYIVFRREEMEEFDINILFGEFLYDMGEYQKAENYFKNLLLTEDTPQRRYSLGTVYAFKGEYHRALDYLDSAHDQYNEILSSMMSTSGDLLNIEEATHILGEMARTLVSIANIYIHTNNPDEALFNYNRALNTYRTIFLDADDSHVGQCIENIGLVYEDRGSYTDAMKNFERANEIFSKTLPENHPSKAGLLLNIANIYKSQNKIDLALQTYLVSLDMMKKVYPANHQSVTECMNNIALTHMKNNQYEDALKWFFDCLKSRNESESPLKAKILTAEIYANMAEIYEKVENIADAIQYYEQSFIIYETEKAKNLIKIEYIDSEYPEDKSREEYSLTDLLSTLRDLKENYSNEHPLITTYLLSIGKMLHNDKKYDEAFEHYKQLLNIHHQFQSVDDFHIAECFYQISLIYQIKGDHSQAMNYAINSYDIIRKLLSAKHPNMKNILKHIVQICNESDEPTKLSFYTRQLNLCLQREEPSTDSNIDNIRYRMFCLYYKVEKHQEALNIVSTKPSLFLDEESETILGQIYLKIGQFHQTIAHTNNALRLSSNPSNIARCYQQLGHAYISQHDNVNALSSYEKALELWQDDDKDEHQDDFANILINIGSIYLQESNYNESLSYYSKALKIKRRMSSENSVLIDNIYNCIAKSFFAQRNYDQALHYYLQLLETLVNEIEIAKINELIGAVYYQKENFQTALLYYKKSLDIADDIDSPNLESLLFDISQTYFQMDNMKYGIEYLRKCIELRESLVDDENDSELIAYKQALSFSQMLLDAQKPKRKRRLKYKRLFHKRHYRRRRKKKTFLRIPAEFSDLATEVFEKYGSSEDRASIQRTTFPAKRNFQNAQ